MKYKMSLSFFFFFYNFTKYLFIYILISPVIEAFPFVFKKIWKLSFVSILSHSVLSTLCNPSDFCHFRNRNNLRWSQKHRGFASGHKTFLLSCILHERCSRFPVVNRLVWKGVILIFWIWGQRIRGKEVVSKLAILKYPLINVVFLASDLVDHFPTQYLF